MTKPRTRGGRFPSSSMSDSIAMIARSLPYRAWKCGGAWSLVVHRDDDTEEAADLRHRGNPPTNARNDYCSPLTITGRVVSGTRHRDRGARDEILVRRSPRVKSSRMTRRRETISVKGPSAALQAVRISSQGMSIRMMSDIPARSSSTARNVPMRRAIAAFSRIRAHANSHAASLGRRRAASS